MIERSTIGDVVALYAKHGWVLRRVLLSGPAKNALGLQDAKLLFDAAVHSSDIDALWFSRPPQPGGVAWELRHLSNSPYALVENIDEDGADLENALSSVEQRLREAVSAKKLA